MPVRGTRAARGYNRASMWELTAFAALSAAIVFWFDSLRAREAALGAGRAACARYELLLLDDTVACVRLRLGRDARGRLHFARTYGFEFSDTGNNRRQGTICLLGCRPDQISLEPYALR